MTELGYLSHAGFPLLLGPTVDLLSPQEGIGMVFLLLRRPRKYPSTATKSPLAAPMRYGG